MKRTIIILFLFIIGLVLLFSSWILSYPLSIDSLEDLVFNHVSVLYWISISILLVSLYLLGIIHGKNYYLTWIISIGIFMVVYSISYFFLMPPGPDSHYFTGLTENFLRTNNLTPTAQSREYYQWPAFFIIAKIMTSVTGIDLAKYEYLLYTIIGFLVTTAVYIYASKFSKRGGLIAVIAFTIAMFPFFNYQFAPFSLAFALLLLLLVLDTKPRRKSSLIVLIVLLFASICIMHAFVALFFILYLLIRSIAGRSSQYRNLFLLSLLVYLVIQINLVSVTLEVYISRLITMPSDFSSYTSIISSHLVPAQLPIDIIAQLFSRGVTVTVAIICFLGFAFLLVKRKLKQLDKALFLTGLVYSSAGTVLYLLGFRAIPLLFLPVSLGAVCLFDGKLRPYLRGIFLILLVFVAFIPLHSSFNKSAITFQTKEALTISTFLIEKNNWASPSEILMENSLGAYISPQVEGMSEIVTHSSWQYTSNIQYYDCIVYSVGLKATLQGENISLSQILTEFNVVYDSGHSQIAQTPQHYP